jgi:hypothetical protein
MARYPKRGRRVRKAKRGGRGKRLTFAQRVQKVISKNVETKMALYVSPDTNTLTYPFGSRFNQAVNGNADAIRLLPDFLNGPAENQRIGNEIRMQSLKLRGVMTVTIPQATANNTRLGVRLLILRNKRINDYIAATTDMGTNFTRLLEAPQSSLNGSLAAFNSPVNTDYFSCVYDKKFYFSQSLSSTSTNSAEVWNSTKFVNINIPYSRRKVLFDEGFDVDTPISYPYFAVLSYTKLSGDSADADGATYVNFQFTTHAKYEDA